MKNLFTLFLISLTTLGFAQQTTTFRPAVRGELMPNSARPPKVNHHAAVSRTSGACDTADVMDYNTYNEIVAGNLQIAYKGSWNVPQAQIQPYANFITSSFITINSYDQQAASYAIAAYDSLAFANYTNTSLYSKSLAGSQVSLDSLGMFMGIAADDTTSAGGLAGDSLVFSIYHITHGLLANAPDTVLTFAGYTGLARFLTGKNPNEIKYCQIQVGKLFAVGQGFAVKYQFFSSDTSSHCILSYSYADSCGTIVISGKTYASPAYASPFIGTAAASIGGQTLVGNSFYGEIDSTAPNTASVTDVSNGTYGYQGLPEGCAHLYIENWEFIPYVTVTSSLGLTISGANPLTLSCPTTSHTIATTKTGDLAGAVYNWSTGQTTASISFFNPGTFDVTVTNSQGCTATDELNAAYPGGLNVTPSFTAPDSICRSQAAGFINTTGLSGYNATWIYGQGPDSLQATTNNVYTYGRGGHFNVTLILDSAGCKFETTQTVPVGSFCVGIDNVAFDNNISIMPNPSNGNVNITINGLEDNVNIMVYNILGQTVRSYTSSDAATVFNKNMDLSNLSDGTYLVKIQSGNKIATKKLVITK